MFLLQELGVEICALEKQRDELEAELKTVVMSDDSNLFYIDLQHLHL